jgi:hypothetical protein
MPICNRPAFYLHQWAKKFTYYARMKRFPLGFVSGLTLFSIINAQLKLNFTSPYYSVVLNMMNGLHLNLTVDRCL